MPERFRTARSVKEFIEIVEPLEEPEWLWFRGQASAEWDLRPRLFRHERVAMSRKRLAKAVHQDDDETREAFIRRAGNFSDIRITDKWNWYFAMQHYGGDTRLLDWTDGALVGLYFAVRDGKGYCDAAVWVLDPWDLNEKVVQRDEVIPPGDPGTSKTDKERYDKWLPSRFSGARWPRKPVAVYPGYIMRRIGAQRSCFTLHGRDQRGLDVIAKELKVPLWKILIPSWCVRSIKKSLETCGLDEATVFSDLEGLGKLVNGWINTVEKNPHDGVSTRLRPSKIAKRGIGAFAIREIKKGKRIFPADPTEMVWVEKSKLPSKPKAIRELYEDFAVRKTDGNDSKMRYGCPVNFDRLTVSWYLNHSREANCGCDDNYNFYALRNIKEGEELTVDYSTYSEGKGVQGDERAFRRTHDSAKRRRKILPRR